jgi:hypothetical protein
MKMDFPHLTETGPAERSRARYAALVASAADRQLADKAKWLSRGFEDDSLTRLSGLEARIGFFSVGQNRYRGGISGAFLPKTEEAAEFNKESESGVNRADSVIMKPNFLGSRYPETSGNFAGHGN